MGFLKWIKDKFGRSAYLGKEESPSLSGTWDAPYTPNSAIRDDRQAVNDRVRQLVRKMPWLEGALEASVCYKVGDGFTHKPCVENERGDADASTNRMLRDAFARWSETAEANGQDTLADIQQLVCRQMIECGESLVLMRLSPKRDFTLQVMEPDCLRTTSPGIDIDQGIQYDSETNRPLKYFLRGLDSTPEISSKEYEWPARNVIHLFNRLRPWQRRGISPLAQTIMLAGDLGEYLTNELAAQQMASRYLAFVTDPSADAVNFDQQARKVLYNLTIEYLPPGKSVQLAPGGNRPTLGVETFQNIFLRILSVKLKTPFHVISGQYANMNYNTLREVRNSTIHLLKKDWGYFSRHFLDRVYREWLDYSVLKGDLTLKGYWDKGGREHYQRCWWMPPGIESVDILRDVQGVIMGKAAGIYDPQDWIMGGGDDPEAVVSGIAEFDRLLKSHGLAIADPSAAIGASSGSSSSKGEEEE